MCISVQCRCPPHSLGAAAFAQLKWRFGSNLSKCKIYKERSLGINVLWNKPGQPFFVHFKFTSLQGMPRSTRSETNILMSNNPKNPNGPRRRRMAKARGIMMMMMRMPRNRRPGRARKSRMKSDPKGHWRMFWWILREIRVWWNMELKNLFDS